MKLLIILIISFFASSILFGQDNIDSQINNSSTLKSYAFAPIISDTTSLTLESLEIPKITGWDIGGQLLASSMSGIIVALIGGLAGSAIEPPSPYGLTVPVAIGVLAGYSFGSALGVYIAASNKKYDRNLLGLIGSSILGEVVGISLYTLSNNDTPNPNVLAFAPLVLPPIFAIITLNAFQQKKSNITVGFDVQQLPQPNAYCYGMNLQYEF